MEHSVDLSEIERQHAELRQTISRLHETVSGNLQKPVTDQERAALQNELNCLRAALVEHFRMEEEGGYLEEVTAAGRGVSVSRLQRQHVEILDELTRITNACGSGGAPKEVRPAVLQVISLLRAHEAEECDLMQEAVTSDTGTGD